MFTLKKEDKLLKKYSTDISLNLKYLLDIYSMNILELSKKAKIAYSAVYKLVNNAASPNLDTLVKISRVFNLNVSQLIGELPMTTEPNFITMVPVIEWNEVQIFLNNSSLDLQKKQFKSIAISSIRKFKNKPFILIANTETEPIFSKGTILVFNKLKLALENYNNKFVLASINQDELPTLKKLYADKNKVILQSVNYSMLNHVLEHNDSIMAYLVQVRVDMDF
jgi:hypothetical protein